MSGKNTYTIYVYGSKRHGCYKVGHTLYPDTRLQQIGFTVPFKVTVVRTWKELDNWRLERELQEALAPKATKHSREWFRLNKNDIDGLPSLVKKLRRRRYRLDAIDRKRCPW